MPLVEVLKVPDDPTGELAARLGRLEVSIQSAVLSVAQLKLTERDQTTVNMTPCRLVTHDENMTCLFIEARDIFVGVDWSNRTTMVMNAIARAIGEAALRWARAVIGRDIWIEVVVKPCKRGEPRVPVFAGYWNTRMQVDSEDESGEGSVGDEAGGADEASSD